MVKYYDYDLVWYDYKKSSLYICIHKNWWIENQSW